MLRLIERQQWSERGVQSEESVQIHSRGPRPIRLRNRDARPELVVAFLTEWHDYVESVHRATLEYCDENLLAPGWTVGGVNGSGQPGRRCPHTEHRYCGALQKCTS